MDSVISASYRGQKISKLLRYPDVTGAVAGLVAMVAISVALVYKDFHFIYLVATGMGIVSIVLYLILRQYNMEEDSSGNNRMISRIFITGSLFFCLLAWLMFVYRAEQYIKPITFYILIACATGLAFYGALKSKSGTQSWIVVGIACIIGLSHIWTEHLLFPSSLIGLDPWTHQAITTGQPSLVAIGGGYSLMHLYLGSVMDLFSISYKWASLIFVGSLQTIGITLFVFLLGRVLWNTKVGCVACLMVASANWVIFFGEWIIPNALGATYSLAVAYLVLKMNKGNTKRLLMLTALIILVAYATHLIAVVWSLGTFACLWVMPILFNGTLNMRAKMKKAGKLLIAPLLGMLVIVLIFHFTWADEALRHTVDSGFAPSYGMTYIVGQVPISAELPEQGEQVSDLVFEPEDGSVLGEMTTASMGMLLYIGLAILGCLIMLKQTTTPMLKTFVVLSLTVLSVGFLPLLFGFSVIEHRWWYFAEVLLAIPLGVALVSLVAMKHQWTIPITILVVIMTFLSTIGLMSNMTNRTLSPNLIVRYAFTEGEIESLTIIQEYGPQIVGTDLIFCPLVVVNTSGIRVIPLIDEILSGNFRDQRADMLLLRDALYEEPFGFGNGAIYKLNYNPVEFAKQQGYSEVYYNGEVHVLVKEGLE